MIRYTQWLAFSPLAIQSIDGWYPASPLYNLIFHVSIHSNAKIICTLNLKLFVIGC